MKTRFFSFLSMGALFNTEHVKGVLNIMSKKLLSEAEFRKFAKLANLSTLAEKKIEEIYTEAEESVEEPVLTACQSSNTPEILTMPPHER